MQDPVGPNYTEGKKFSNYLFGIFKPYIFLLACAQTCQLFESDLMATR